MSCTRYGLPYVGSKNDIADKLLALMPPAETFVDLFAGGCAVTHCAMLSGKYKRFIVNDICDAPQLFVDAINGKYRDEKRWISREDFFRLKDTDPYVRYVWSFGNNGNDYIYGKHIEGYKKAYHYAVCFDDFSLFEAMGIHVEEETRGKMKGLSLHDRRLTIRRWVTRNEAAVRQAVGGKYATKEQFDNPRQIKALQNVRRVERLNRVIGLTRPDLQQHLHATERIQEIGNVKSKKDKEVLYSLTSGHNADRLNELQGLRKEKSKKEIEHLRSLEHEIRRDLLDSSCVARPDCQENLQRNETPQAMERQESLELSRRDYADVPLPDGAVVYCDPPYFGTDCGSYSGFDHERFYNWLRANPMNKYISEHQMPDDFVCIAEMPKLVRSQRGQVRGTERLFVHRDFDKVRIKSELFLDPDAEPERYVTEMPKEFNEYVKDNEERIMSALSRGTAPYWVRDNAEYISVAMSGDDVQTIDETYNENYLRAEYNFVAASGQMAERWEQFAEDGDEYNLQYRTAGDSRVRPEHAKLNGITLPFSHRFWDEYYPPNGWNCRCTVVQVRKEKYPVTDEGDVFRRAADSISAKEDMFRFNPGKQEKAVPDYNPYTIRQCKNCPIANGDVELARTFIANNELCQACYKLRVYAAHEKTKRLTQ
ncbi:MAG: minor capsid protein, partial [Prevotella sp.]|nr:minor capsid protein [Prevotella sp.]